MDRGGHRERVTSPPVQGGYGCQSAKCLDQRHACWSPIADGGFPDPD